MSDTVERDVYLQLRDIQTTHSFLPGKIPKLAGKAADEIERLRAERDELRAVLRSCVDGASASAEQMWETAKRFRTAVEYKVDGMLLGDNEAARAALACKIVGDLISRASKDRKGTL